MTDEVNGEKGETRKNASVGRYEGIEEAVVLYTCNRMEVYAGAQDTEVGAASIRRFIANCSEADDELDCSLLIHYCHLRSISYGDLSQENIWCTSS